MVKLLAIVVLYCCACAVSSESVAARLYPIDCVIPSCITEQDRSTIWPFEDPNFFVRCEPTGAPWELVRHPCTGRRLFHFARQMCTVPEDWEEPCADLPTLDPLEPCPEVRCNTAADLRRLWPMEDPSLFLQCIPQAAGGIAPVGHVCPNGLLFSVRQQACITVHRWQRECSFEGENTPGPTGGDTDPTTTIPWPPPSSTTPATQSPPPSTSTVPDWILCQPPICLQEDPILYPHSNPSLFWQCVPQPSGYWLALERPCAAGTFFHFALQQCVFPADWVNFCPV
uniref:Chitin-binding type-2 domain-containing protein n=1 Tax=Anopheles maculatus TaxID=74869 RepID=A0A182SCX3_9DIPT